MLFFAGCLLFVTGCADRAAEPTAALSVALTEECAAPCWRGIRPGATTSEEAQAQLEAHFGAQAVVREGDFLTWTVAEGVMGRAALVEGRVGALTFELAPGRLTVEQLLAQVGEPDEVHVSLPHVPRDSGGAGAEAAGQCELLRLRYPQQELEATLYESESGSVLPAQSVARLYLAPARPELSMMTPFYAREWSDYGSYCVTVEEIFEE